MERRPGSASEPISEPFTIVPESGRSPGVIRPLLVRIAPGQSTGWHRHDGWQTGIVVSGRIRHRTADAERVYGPGDVMVETPGVDHEATNVAEVEASLLVLAVHPEGCPLTTPRPMPGG